MKTPPYGSEVTLTSGHTVTYLGRTDTGGIRVRSKRLGITYETAADRLPQPE